MYGKDQEGRMENLKGDAALRACAFLYENIYAIIKHVSHCIGRSIPSFSLYMGEVTDCVLPRRSRYREVTSLNESSGSRCSTMVLSLPYYGANHEPYRNSGRGDQQIGNFNYLSNNQVRSFTPATSLSLNRDTCFIVAHVGRYTSREEAIHTDERNICTI